MTDILANPAFGILLTIITFQAGLYIYRRTGLVFLHPVVISLSLCIAFLLIFKIDYKYYKQGGDMISFFLGPATVILAVPLYKHLSALLKNIVPILIGVVVGSVTALVSVILLGQLLGLECDLIISLLAKSVTIPIGVEMTRQLGGNPSVIVIVIFATGLLGAVIGPSILKLCRIKNSIAVGIALGTASHAIGTSRAIEIGEVEGAMGGLAIGLAGLATVLAAPLIMHLLL
jgi:predicted murein hydrolase (TIGR00659 family)